MNLKTENSCVEDSLKSHESEKAKQFLQAFRFLSSSQKHRLYKTLEVLSYWWISNRKWERNIDSYFFGALNGPDDIQFQGILISNTFGMWYPDCAAPLLIALKQMKNTSRRAEIGEKLQTWNNTAFRTARWIDKMRDPADAWLGIFLQHNLSNVLPQELDIQKFDELLIEVDPPQYVKQGRFMPLNYLSCIIWSSQNSGSLF